MKQCEKCGLSIGGDLERCPLCQAELSGCAEPSVFPHNETKKSGSLALKVLAFATGLILVSLLPFSQALELPTNILVVVGLALVLNYLFVRNIIAHRPDFLRAVARYFLILLATSVLWFILTQNLWVSTFVIPGVCMLALVFDAILIAVFRETFVTGYAKYLLFSMILGLTPLVFVALGLTLWSVPAYASAFISSILFLALIIFMRRQLLDELRKLFSV